MKEDFEPQLQAHVVRDDSGRVRAIRPSQEHWASEEGSPLATAISYLREMASTYEVSGTELTNLTEPSLLDCGGRVDEHPGLVGAVLTSDRPDLLARRFPGAWEASFQRRARLAVPIEPFTQTVVGIKVAVPENARPGSTLRLDVVQRNRRTKQTVGGIAVEVNVTEEPRTEPSQDPSRRKP